MLAPTAPLKVTVKVSVPSANRSLVMGTVMVRVVVPTGKVNVPVVAEKSVPEVALPLEVVKFTVTTVDAAGANVTVNVAVPAPSLTVTSSMDNPLPAGGGGGGGGAVTSMFTVAVAVPPLPSEMV